MLPLTAAEGLSGIIGIAAQVIEALGEAGVGLLILIETVFPPVPSEVILPLAGFLSNTGDLNVWLVVVTSTTGSYLGALLLYWLAARLGEERAIRLLSKLPLVDRSDFERAGTWFRRHGRSAVFFGRLVPGVRSLISLPAGAQRMPLLAFTAFTVGGSLLWNGVLIGAGFALGEQYELVDRYSRVLNYIVVAGFAAIVVWLLIRRSRRRRSDQVN